MIEMKKEQWLPGCWGNSDGIQTVTNVSNWITNVCANHIEEGGDESSRPK